MLLNSAFRQKKRTQCEGSAIQTGMQLRRDCAVWGDRRVLLLRLHKRSSPSESWLSRCRRDTAPSLEQDPEAKQPTETQSADISSELCPSSLVLPPKQVKHRDPDVLTDHRSLPWKTD